MTVVLVIQFELYFRGNYASLKIPLSSQTELKLESKDYLSQLYIYLLFIFMAKLDESPIDMVIFIIFMSPFSMMIRRENVKLKSYLMWDFLPVTACVANRVYRKKTCHKY